MIDRLKNWVIDYSDRVNRQQNGEFKLHLQEFPPERLVDSLRSFRRSEINCIEIKHLGSLLIVAPVAAYAIFLALGQKITDDHQAMTIFTVISGGVTNLTAGIRERWVDSSLNLISNEIQHRLEKLSQPAD